jgi:hypothetical protein
MSDDRKDEAYRQGVEDGQKSDFMDQFAQSLAKGFSIDPEVDECYNKGYDYGVAHRDED